MTIFEMLGQSGILTLLGMGVVFGFLTIMVFAINLSGKLVHALGWDKDITEPAKPAPWATPIAAAPATPLAAGRANASAVTAAISAAIQEYEKSENR